MSKQKHLESTVVAPAQEEQHNWWSKSTVAAAPEQRNKILQTINFNLGSFDDKERSFMAIASSPCVDRQGDVVLQEGWDLTNFKNNPVIPWAHDYSQPPVARAVEIGVADGVLQMKVQFPPEGLYPFADTIWNLYRNQFLFAFSVGFIPEEPEEGWSWEGNTFRRCELLEVSAVVVPANPQALALAAKQGVIDTAQAKLLVSRLDSASSNLKDALKAQEIDAKAEKAVATATDAKDAAALVREILEEAGILKSANAEDLTDINSKKDNETMSKNKDLSESNGGDALAPIEHAGDVAKTVKSAADLLTDHAKALREHSDTMAAHADAIESKADELLKAFDLLDHNGDETTRPEEADDNDGDDGTDGNSKAADAAVTKDVEGEEEAAPAAEGTEEVSQPAEAENADVDGEVKSEEAAPAAAEEEVAEEAAPAEEAAAEAAPADGADHEEKAEEELPAEDAAASDAADAVEEKFYDPNNLSDEDVQEILASLNKRVK